MFDKIITPVNLTLILSKYAGMKNLASHFVAAAAAFAFYYYFDFWEILTRKLYGTFPSFKNLNVSN